MFTHAYSPSPICSPARSGLLTGRHPTRIGCTHYKGGGSPKQQPGGLYLQAEFTCNLQGPGDTGLLTIADAFQQNGYRTGMAGKWHASRIRSSSKWTGPTAHGFEVFIAGGQVTDAGKTSGPSSMFPPYFKSKGECIKMPRTHALYPCDLNAAEDAVCDICQQRNHTTLASETLGTPDASRSTSSTAAGRVAGDYLTRQLVQASAERMELMHQSGRPFFMFHSFFAVHTPIQSPKEVVVTYDAKLRALYPDSYKHGWQGREAFGTGAGIDQPDPGKPRWTRLSNKLRVLQADTEYAGMVKEVDDAVGVLLDKIDDLGIQDDTVVVFTSDHGGHSTHTSNLPLRAGKGWVYEGGARVSNSNITPFCFQNGTTSGFEMCLGLGTLRAGAKTRLESGIETFTPHCICRYSGAEHHPFSWRGTHRGLSLANDSAGSFSNPAAPCGSGNVPDTPCRRHQPGICDHNWCCKHHATAQPCRRLREMGMPGTRLALALPALLKPRYPHVFNP